jgi:predicted dehydrogenase
MSKLSWGMIGGGEGSQIGPAHRLGAGLDGLFEFKAAALDYRAEEGKRYGCQLGLSTDRSYGSWQDMLAAEQQRDDRIDLVTVATPNATHFEITRAFLQAGFHVLCEKPMTMTVEEGEEIVRQSEATGKICAVNYGYSGYSLVRHMRAMITGGDLGNIRLIKAEFAHGHHADAADADNPRVRWRYDPAQAGVSAQFADCGIHALHMACFVTGQEVTRLSSDNVSCIASRELEDDAMVNFRMTGNIVGRLWTSSIAIGRQHGLTLQVFGEKGGLRWSQEHPNQLYYMPLNERLQIIERGEDHLSAEADRSSRVTIGHAEGMPLAFANIYKDLAEAITAHKQGRAIDPAADLYPRASDGLRSMAAVSAVAESGHQQAAWVDARPPMYR